MCAWRTRWVIAIGLGAAVAGAGIAWWRLERRLDGRDTTWLTDPGADSPRGLLFDTFVNGSHPLLPWLAFFCAGIVVGRALSQPWWRPVALAGGATLFGVATMVAAGASGGARRPARDRAVVAGPAVHGQRARHGSRRVRRDHVAGRALAGLTGRTHAAATPAP